MILISAKLEEIRVLTAATTSTVILSTILKEHKESLMFLRSPLISASSSRQSYMTLKT